MALLEMELFNERNNFSVIGLRRKYFVASYIRPNARKWLLQLLLYEIAIAKIGKWQIHLRTQHSLIDVTVKVNRLNERKTSLNLPEEFRYLTAQQIWIDIRIVQLKHILIKLSIINGCRIHILIDVAENRVKLKHGIARKCFIRTHSLRLGLLIHCHEEDKNRTKTSK